ncbi:MULTISPECIES: flavodoxin domain-containing protein [Haloferax]|uniref:Protoporphyrinogen oxidase n=2 Tax=Haloferax TaxID=2251 RepID=M0I6I2_9EURY|nr:MULTISPECIES: flavodoxin domain-containing protein [Haloferax]ELZ91014.1 protoporphyrinogen oxidase [Haloferax sulfurifontis ATCC BAA-897]MDS0241088.1 flavodoxin domain-containing protein [Haloferax sp. S2CR25]MDS0444209.1 flavodoxin domain-containing protein [Haloferax sp. S2CR25-2]CQR49473.1 Protoporphyrinogen IX dehydrogenase [menaquinone] [Haloferax massiliensis]
MGTILVAYGSKEGQTEKIAGRIAMALAAHGYDVRTESVTDDAAGEAVADADAVLVGSSIHMGAHSKQVYAFVREYREDIEARPNGFFQVSLSSALDDEDARAEVATYIDEFVEESGWHPERMAAFGGALRYSEYGFLTRMVMKRIAKGATGDTDASRDYEYTDWDEVETFAADFADFVDSTAGTAAGGAAV